MQFSSDICVTGCTAGRLFFFSVSNLLLVPIGMIALPGYDGVAVHSGCGISTGCVDRSGNCVVVGTVDGKLFRVALPSSDDSQKRQGECGYEISTSISEIHPSACCHVTPLP